MEMILQRESVRERKRDREREREREREVAAENTRSGHSSQQM